ncbi:MAG: hypothetical protein Q9191_001921 [Dirinaria sp. TL-2023a]
MLRYLGQVLGVFVTLSLLSTIYLYFYPAFHACAFPPQVATENSYVTTFKHAAGFSAPHGHIDAPFRLLALGDPQLEGDSSLLNTTNGYFPSIATLWSDLSNAESHKSRLSVVAHHLWNVIVGDVPWILYTCRKTVDLWGNDYYLAHIYRTLHRSLRPTHVTVLGDLLGSQWISDDEFERRGWRYWNRVFRGGRRVEDEVTSGIHLGPLGQDRSWETRIINVAGNHDIGYAGDITTKRMDRFERVFGKANWETRFAMQPGNQTASESYTHVESLPELRLVVLNSLNLDTPALEPHLQTETYQFINDMIVVSRPVEDTTSATILLTHVPLHKEAGVCVDGPYFSFHDEDHGGGLKEQNHLSYEAARGILEGIYGMSGNPNAPAGGLGRNGIILTGHDHEGCDVYHHLPDDEDKEARRWKAESWATSAAKQDDSIPGIREVTVRSMMGGFGGNAGLLSAWYDPALDRWRLEHSTCALGTQHIWWTVHVLQLITVALVVSALADFLRGGVPTAAKSESKVLKPRRRATTLDRWLETANGRANDGSSPIATAASGVENAAARLSKRRPP